MVPGAFRQTNEACLEYYPSPPRTRSGTLRANGRTQSESPVATCSSVPNAPGMRRFFAGGKTGLSCFGPCLYSTEFREARPPQPDESSLRTKRKSGDGSIQLPLPPAGASSDAVRMGPVGPDIAAEPPTAGPPEAREFLRPHKSVLNSYFWDRSKNPISDLPRRNAPEWAERPLKATPVFTTSASWWTDRDLITTLPEPRPRTGHAYKGHCAPPLESEKDPGWRVDHGVKKNSDVGGPNAIHVRGRRWANLPTAIESAMTSHFHKNCIRVISSPDGQDCDDEIRPLPIREERVVDSPSESGAAKPLPRVRHRDRQ